MVVSLWHFIRRRKPELSLAEVLDVVCDGHGVCVGWGGDGGSAWCGRLGARPVILAPAQTGCWYEDLVRDGNGSWGAEEDAGDVEAVVELSSFERMRGWRGGGG